MENSKMPIYPSEGYISQQQEFGFTQTGNGDFGVFHGLTKREYFAGLAMQAMVTRAERYAGWGEVESEQCLYIADNLLQKLENTK